MRTKNRNIRILRPLNKSDLERMEMGDLVRVSVEGAAPVWKIYEGTIEGKDAFLDLEYDFEGERNLYSWRIERESIKVKKRNILMEICDADLQEYTPDSDGYYEKLELLAHTKEAWE